MQQRKVGPLSGYLIIMRNQFSFLFFKCKQSLERIERHYSKLEFILLNCIHARFKLSMQSKKYYLKEKNNIHEILQKKGNSTECERYEHFMQFCLVRYFH